MIKGNPIELLKKLAINMTVFVVVVAGIAGFADVSHASEVRSDNEFVIENGVLTKYNGQGGEVVVPYSVTKIGNSAFSQCSNVTSVILPDGVTEIENYAFEYCDKMKSIVIGEKVKKIGICAFDSCLRITDVFYKGSSQQWSEVSIGEYNICLTSATMHYYYGCNHTGTQLRNSKASTCTVAGYTGDTYCLRCGELVTKGSTTAKKAHSYVTTTVKADSNTKKNGSTTVKCKNCGNVKSTSAIYYASKIELTGKNYAYYKNGSQYTKKPEYTYNGKAKKPKVTVYDSKGNKIAASNYTVTYSNNINAGENAKAVVTMKGNYKGKLSGTFVIDKADNYVKVTKDNLSKLKDVTSKGATQKLKIKATAKKGKLTYKTNVSKVKVDKNGVITIPGGFSGSVRITITAQGDANYLSETKWIYMYVKIKEPKTPKVLSVTNTEGRKIIIRISKVNNADGYQIQCTDSSNFNNAKAFDTDALEKSLSSYLSGSAYKFTLTNLTMEKKYKIRTRAYTKLSGKRYYSSWSSAKTIKVTR